MALCVKRPDHSVVLSNRRFTKAVVTTTIRLRFDCSSTARLESWNDSDVMPRYSDWQLGIVGVYMRPGGAYVSTDAARDAGGAIGH